MVKYRRQAKKGELNDPLSRWLAWLNKNSPPELIAEVVKMDSAIQAANERMVYITGDKEAIRAYERRQMALSDYTSAINYAHRTGMTKGRQKGILDIARNLKKMGLPITQIAEGTGLPAETIDQL